MKDSRHQNDMDEQETTAEALSTRERQQYAEAIKRIAELEAALLVERTILESITDAFVALDHAWRIVNINSQAEPLMQKKREELLGKNIWDIYSEAIETSFYSECHRAMFEQVTVSFEDYYAPFDRWFEVRAYPSANGLAVYFHDITLRKQQDIERAELLRREQEARMQAEATQKRLRTMLDVMPAGVVIADAHGQILEINAALKAIWGENMPLVGAIGEYAQYSTWWPDTGKLLTAEERAISRALLKGEKTYGEMLDIQTFDGQRKTVLSSAAPIRDEHNAIVGAVGVVLDITERRRMEQRTHDMLNSLLKMAWILVQPPESRVPEEQGGTDLPLVAQRLAELTCNVLGCSRVGVSTIDSETGTAHPVAVVGLTEEEERYWKKQQTGKIFSDNPDQAMVAQLRDGNPIVFDKRQSPWNVLPNPLEVSTVLIVPMYLNNRLIGILSLDHGKVPHTYTQNELDLAKAVAQLVALIIDRDRLVREQQAMMYLRETNRELAAQNQRSQEANRIKSEFLANMSHELRTPLNGIIGFTELMVDGRVGQEEHLEFLGDILTSSKHLLQLINDILDLSKVEAGKIVFEPELVHLPKLVNEVCNILHPLISKKRLHLSLVFDPDLTAVTLDPSKLKQVLYNYLSNAIKFTPEDGRVTIRSLPEGADRFRVEVEDTGIGIQTKDFNRLFVAFQQLDTSTTKKYQGTGLGLVLTKSIIEAQGGTVGMESTPGKGSTFWITLPRLVPAQIEDVSAKTVLPLAKPGARSILVIEDNTQEQTWLAQTLAEAGYDVEVAINGEQALARCSVHHFDAITLDLFLPDKTGLEVLQAIRAEGLNGDTPVVVVTVVAEKGISVSYHIHEYLTKPVQAEELLTALERVGIRSSENRTVLVIDDDVTLLKLMHVTLSQAGYQPICHSDGASGLQAIIDDPPAVLVLDLLMPEINGWEFLERLRTIPIGKDIPVIVWTNEDLTSEDYAQLRRKAQTIVMKSNAGVASVLQAIQSCVPASDAIGHQ